MKQRFRAAMLNATRVCVDSHCAQQIRANPSHTTSMYPCTEGATIAVQSRGGVKTALQLEGRSRLQQFNVTGGDACVLCSAARDFPRATSEIYEGVTRADVDKTENDRYEGSWDGTNGSAQTTWRRLRDMPEIALQAHESHAIHDSLRKSVRQHASLRLWAANLAENRREPSWTLSSASFEGSCGPQFAQAPMSESSACVRYIIQSNPGKHKQGRDTKRTEGAMPLHKSQCSDCVQ